MLWRRATFVCQSNLFRKHNGNLWFSSARKAPRNILTWYATKLDTHPLLTKGISSGIINCAGDVICQYLSNTDEEFQLDWLRAGRFLIMGSFFVAPITHAWYSLLSNRMFPGPSTFRRVTQRVIVDQFGFAPIFIPGFMGSLWLLEGRENITSQLIELTPEVVVSNWLLWIPAMTLNFSVIPVKYHVLYSNVVALLWTIYLSWTNEESKKIKVE